MGRLRDALTAFKFAFLGRTIIYRASIGPPERGMIDLTNSRGIWINRSNIDCGGYKAFVGLSAAGWDDMFASATEVSLNENGTANFMFGGATMKHDK